jgi:hypothetical protein
MPKQIEVHAPQQQPPIDLSGGEIRDKAAARVRLNGWLKKFLTEKRSPLPVGFDRIIRQNMRGQQADPDLEVVGGLFVS